MKQVIILIIGLLLLAPFVSSHAIDKEPIIKNTANYQIQFSTQPKFPVTRKNTNLEFVIKNNDKVLQPNLNMKIELHKDEKTISLALSEEKTGHYGADYVFKDAGNFKIHIFTEGKELKTEFDLEMDNFGISGLLRSLIIILFIEVLIIKIVVDCKKKKKKAKKRSLKKNSAKRSSIKRMRIKKESTKKKRK